MKLIIILSFIALSSANALYGSQKEIRVDNNNRIFLRVPGKIVVLETPKNDREGVMVFVKEPGHIKKVIIDKDKNIVKHFSFSLGHELPETFSDEEQDQNTSSSSEENTTTSQNSGNDKTQMELLVTIFKKYQGIIAEDTFKELVKDVKKIVDNKDCHPIILRVLKELEGQTTYQTSLFWPMHRNIEVRTIRDKTQQEEREDKQTRKEMLETKQENQMNHERSVLVDEKVQQLLKNSEEQLEDTLHTTGSSFRFTKPTDCSKDALSEQLRFQRNIRELQGQIFSHQLTTQQLQLQQQFLNQQKHHTKLQIMVGQQRGISPTQMQELNRVRNELQKKESEILGTQKDLHFTIHKLQQELSRQMEKLQQCLDDERKADEITMRV